MTTLDLVHVVTSNWKAIGATILGVYLTGLCLLLATRRHTPRGTTTPSQDSNALLAQRLNRAAVPILALVALGGAALSYTGVAAATPAEFGPFRYVLPLLCDAEILGASLRYISLVKLGRPAAGWRLAAHGGVAATIWLNVLSTPTASAVPWHLIGPGLWSILVELAARDVLGELRAVRGRLADRIPLRLWLTNFEESARASWRMARTGQTNATAARAETQRCAAVRDVLVTVMPRSRGRRQVLARLWSGALDPATLTRIILTARPDGIVTDTATEIHLRAMTTVAGLTALPTVEEDTTPALEPTRYDDETTAHEPTTEDQVPPTVPLRVIHTTPDPTDEIDPAVPEILDIVGQGERVPGIKKIRQMYRCGDTRAYQIRDQVHALLEQGPRKTGRA